MVIFMTRQFRGFYPPTKQLADLTMGVLMTGQFPGSQSRVGTESMTLILLTTHFPRSILLSINKPTVGL
jgi:hypothetical protein